MALLLSMGCLTPAGVGVEPLSELLKAGGEIARRPPPEALGETIPLPQAGWIDPILRPGSWLGRPVRFARLDRLSQLALIVAQQAVAAAGGLPTRDERAGIALGTAAGAHLANELFWRGVMREGAQGASPAVFSYTLPSSAAGELSICLGLRGPILTLARGAGSGLAALAAAAELIDAGQADWMLAGGADSLGTTLLCSRGEQAGELAEASALLVLGAEAGDARPLARMAGWAQASGPGALERATALALQQAGVQQEKVATRVGYPPTEGRTFGALDRFMAAGPVLGLCLLLARSYPLPALVASLDPDSVANVLCLLPW